MTAALTQPDPSTEPDRRVEVVAPCPSQIIAATGNPAAVASSASHTLRASRGPRRLPRGTVVWGEGGSEPVNRIPATPA